MEDKIYINVLIDTLNKKSSILDELIDITEMQDGILTSKAVDMEKILQTFSEKEKLITHLNLLDDGFDKIYQHAKGEFTNNKWKYKEQVLSLQKSIIQITEKSTKLQASELRNKRKMQKFYKDKKSEVKNLKVSSKTADSYYRNVMNQQNESSYFFDKKK